MTEPILDAEPVSDQPPWRGWLRLKFAGELEKEFRTSYRAATRRWIRLSMIVALSTVLGFAVIDHQVLTGPSVADADLVRFGLQLPIVLTILLLTSQRFYVWYQPAVQVAAPLFGLGLVVMAVQASQEQIPLIAARLLLCTFFFYFMLGLSFHAALRTNALLVAGYAATALMGTVSPPVVTYQLFLLICANLIGAAGCYALEHANRVAFLERRRLAEVAMHDGLTGLLNRTALEQQVRQLWQQAARDSLPISVILVDIDHFKAYNDRYGHQAGDRCLKKVASTVRRAARRRPLDLVARYGGEELIAVLFGADQSHAEAVSRDILEAVTGLSVPHTSSPIRPHVTVSVGATTLHPNREHSPDMAVQLADRALYFAKERGRDCWSFCGEQFAKDGYDLFASGILKTG